jgi:hypothetical protein
MVVPNANPVNERFLDQMDFLGQDFHFGGGSVAVNVNVDIGHLFQTKKGSDKETHYPLSYLI